LKIILEENGVVCQLWRRFSTFFTTRRNINLNLRFFISAIFSFKSSKKFCLLGEVYPLKWINITTMKNFNLNLRLCISAIFSIKSGKEFFPMGDVCPLKWKNAA